MILKSIFNQFYSYTQMYSCKLHVFIDAILFRFGHTCNSMLGTSMHSNTKLNGSFESIGLFPLISIIMYTVLTSNGKRIQKCILTYAVLVCIGLVAVKLALITNAFLHGRKIMVVFQLALF